MARARAPIYLKKDFIPMENELEQVREIIGRIKTSNDMRSEIDAALRDLEAASKADKKITRSGHKVGYGVDKARRNIACDTAISIIREIKKQKGW